MSDLKCIKPCGYGDFCQLGTICSARSGGGKCCVRDTPPPPPSPGPPPPSPGPPPPSPGPPPPPTPTYPPVPENCKTKSRYYGTCDSLGPQSDCSQFVSYDSSLKTWFECNSQSSPFQGGLYTCVKGTSCKGSTPAPSPPAPSPPTPPAPSPPSPSSTVYYCNSDGGCTKGVFGSSPNKYYPTMSQCFSNCKSSPPSPGPPSPPSPGPPPPPSPGPPSPPSPGPPPPSPGPPGPKPPGPKPPGPKPPGPKPPGPKPPGPTPSFTLVNPAPNSVDQKYKSYHCFRNSKLDYSKLGGMYDQFTKRSSDDYQKQYAWPKDFILPDKQTKPERLQVTHNCLTLPKNNCHEHYQLVKNENNDQWEPKSCILTPERIQGSLFQPGTSYDNQGKSKPSCIVSTGTYSQTIKTRDLNSETNVPKIQCKQYKQKRTSGDGSKHYEYCDQTGSCTWTSDPPGPLNINPFVTDPEPTPEPVPTPDPTPYIPPPPPKKTPSVTPSSSMSTSEIIGILILVLIVLIIPFLIYWLNRTRTYQ